MRSRSNRDARNATVPDWRTMVRILTRTRFQLQLVAAVAFWVFLINSDCQGQSANSTAAVSGSSPSSSVKFDPTSIILELNQAIAILKQGMAENWGTRDRYLSAFEKTPNVDSVGRPVTDAKSYVECVMDRHFRKHEVWDEGVPIDAEARLTVIELLKLREYGEKAAREAKQLDELQLPPCASSEQRKIVISAGVARALLKTRLNPIYPVNALQHSVSGTVTLHATIGIDGHIAELKIVSGPEELYQAALNAVRQWTYQPYQLDGRPVEVETTVSVPFEITDSDSSLH